MTYQDALDYVATLTNYEQHHDAPAMRAVTLERMQQLCERLGNPQQRFRSILVAGTNGKGSICAMLYAILRAAKFRVGLYTSPHLENARERFRVSAHTAGSSDWISEDAFASVIERLKPFIDESAHAPQGPLTYFEVMTAAALLHFAQQRVQIAVLEVGLGGRLDATNVAEPAVSVLGPVGFDHTDILGHDLVAIAKEKAGVMRAGHPVVSAPQEPAVAACLREATAASGCPLIEVGHALSSEVLAHSVDGLELSVRTPRGRYDDLQLPLLGRHQADNAAVAVAAVEALSETGVPHRAVRSGLAKVSWPGRCEVVQEAPVVLLDGAHNPQAATTLRATIEELWPEREIHLLVGMSADKPVRPVGECLGPMATSVTCTRSHHPRACPAQQLADQWRPFNRRLHVIDDPIDAYTYLLNRCAPEAVIVITGSLFLVGELRTALWKAHIRTRTVRRPRRTRYAEAD